MAWLMDQQLDPKSGELLMRSLEGPGVQFYLEKLTTAILGDDRVAGLEFKDGTTLDCDMVVISAGIRPNVDLARMAGLHVRRGILVNDSLACRNDQNIYAIGECAEHRSQTYGLVAPLWDQARVLAERLAGQNAEAAYTGSRIATKLKVMDVELAVAGDKDALTEDDEVVTYVEPNRHVYKKVIVRDGKVTGAILLGDGSAAPRILQAFDRQEALPENRSELLFPMAGDGGSAPESRRPAGRRAHLRLQRRDQGPHPGRRKRGLRQPEGSLRRDAGRLRLRFLQAPGAGGTANRVVRRCQDPLSLDGRGLEPPRT